MWCCDELRQVMLHISCLGRVSSEHGSYVNEIPLSRRGMFASRCSVFLVRVIRDPVHPRITPTADARISLPSVCPSVCLSVRLSVCHASVCRFVRLADYPMPFLFPSSCCYAFMFLLLSDIFFYVSVFACIFACFSGPA